MARQYKAETFKGTTTELAERLTTLDAEGWVLVDVWPLNEASLINDCPTKFGILLASDNDGEADVTAVDLVAYDAVGDEVV